MIDTIILAGFFKSFQPVVQIFSWLLTCFAFSNAESLFATFSFISFSNISFSFPESSWKNIFVRFGELFSRSEIYICPVSTITVFTLMELLKLEFRTCLLKLRIVSRIHLTHIIYTYFTQQILYMYVTCIIHTSTHTKDCVEKCFNFSRLNQLKHTHCRTEVDKYYALIFAQN